VLQHGAQVDVQESLALRMACDPFGPDCCRRRSQSRLTFTRSRDQRDLTTPIVRCLLDHGATIPADCAVGSLSVGTVACLAEFGHREALHHPRTFGTAVVLGERPMIDYLMQQGVNVDAGIREACTLRDAHSTDIGFWNGRGAFGTIADGLCAIINNSPANAPMPFTYDTIDIACQGDPAAAAVLVLNVTPVLLDEQERESIANGCLRKGYVHLAVQLITKDKISVESDVAEQILIKSVAGFSVGSQDLMDQLDRLQFPKLALDHALMRALEAIDTIRPWHSRAHIEIEAKYEAAKKLIQHGASLPAEYEEETARSGDARRAQFMREVEMDTAPLTKAAH